LPKIIALDPEIAFALHGAIQCKIVLKSPHQELRPDNARVVLTLGRMMFEFERTSNGEGLENCVFRCILL